MARDNRDRLTAPMADGGKRPAFRALGHWNAEKFEFTGPDEEREWLAQAYRQSVHPDRWQGKPPVDAHTQSLLDDVPHLGAGQFFRGPDGKHRRITTDLREDKDIEAIRRHAFNRLAQTGVTWAELGQYPDHKPHPGEEEALALAQGNRAAANKSEESVYPNKMRDMGAQPREKVDVTRVVGDIDLDLTSDAAIWAPLPKEPAQPPILVASTDKAVSGLPKEVVGRQPFLPPATTTPGQRRNFNESLVGRAANDNHRTTNREGSANASLQGAAVHVDSKSSKLFAGKATGAANTAHNVDEDQEISDRLFNWSRDVSPLAHPFGSRIRSTFEPSSGCWATGWGAEPSTSAGVPARCFSGALMTA
jgi:hypothetical protein